MGNITCGCSQSNREERGEFQTKPTSSSLANSGRELLELDLPMADMLLDSNDLLEQFECSFTAKLMKNSQELLFRDKDGDKRGCIRAVIFNKGSCFDEPEQFVKGLSCLADLTTMSLDDLFDLGCNYEELKLESVYFGDIFSSTRHGSGQEIWADDTAYQGEYRNGTRHGYGVYSMPDGSLYEGEFLSDVRTGYGKLTQGDGTVYAGGWKDNLRQGQGTEIWCDGRKYIGSFEKDSKAGEGRYYWPDGKISGVKHKNPPQ